MQGRNPTKSILAAAGLLTAVLVVACGLLPRGLALAAVSDIAGALLMLLAFVAFALQGFASKGRMRLFWMLQAAGWALWFGDQLVWITFDLILQQKVPSMYPADALLFLAGAPMIAGLLRFLRGGVATDGHALFECGHDQHRAVTYHTAALAAAFARAGHLGMNGYHDVAQRSCSYLFGLQRRDGSFAHSRREYHLLSDQRSYPRYLSMVLYLLLEPLCADEQSRTRRERGRVG